MPDLPSASVTIDPAAGGLGAGTDYLVVLLPCATNADLKPRVFASTKALLDFHGYAPGVDYLAHHYDETGLPAIVVPMPIVTAGVISQQDDSQVDGTCAITVTGTPLEECDLELTVTHTGTKTIGTDQILFDLSLDGGRTTKSVKLGTATSYVVPYVGITLNFAAGTLIADDLYTCRTTAPKPDQAGIQDAREALAEQLKVERSWLCPWDVATEDEAQDIVTEVNAYDTTNDRFKHVRVQARDAYPAAKLSNVGTITFAEVDATGDTITRSAGSFIADGFRVGQILTITGSASNNVTTDAITAVTATVITLDTTDLEAEGPVAAGTVRISAPAETLAAWKADIDGEFEDIADEPRIDLGGGRARKLSKITGWRFRRPVQWAASIREYQHDVHIPTWRKQDGPLSGWDLEDEDGNIVEHDERTDGGLLAAGFTCFRTWSNGPAGTYIAKSVTRGDRGSLLSRTHNMAVVNVAMLVVQSESEQAIGQVLILNANGTGSEASLKVLEARVNSSLAIHLLQDRREGPRASSAKWTASRTDVLNVVDAVLTGTLDIRLGATIEHVQTRVRVQTAG